MLQGYWKDTYKWKDGKTIETEWKKNQICYAGEIALMAILNGETGFNTGIGNIWYAVGEGDSDWDALETLPLPTVNNTKLLAELTPAVEARKNPILIQYLDNSGDVSVTPTRTLYIKTFLADSDLSGEYLREFGLFIGNATQITDSGYLLNRVIHDKIHKGSFSLTRQIKLVLS